MKVKASSKEHVVREILRRTPLISPSLPLELPKREGVPSVKVIFAPEISGNARVRYSSGCRIIDWENGEWVSYEKEGVQWYRDELTDLDYEILFSLLADQIRLLFADNESEQNRL